MTTTTIIEQLLTQPITSQPELPVFITARFEPLDGYVALGSLAVALQIAGHNTPALFLTVIHDGCDGITSETMRGDQTGKVFRVRDGESVLVVARFEGRIIAGAMLGVDTDLVESIDMLLSPVATSNIVVDQHNMLRSGVSLVSKEEVVQ
jgi:hypothetical protein